MGGWDISRLNQTNSWNSTFSKQKNIQNLIEENLEKERKNE